MTRHNYFLSRYRNVIGRPSYLFISQQQFDYVVVGAGSAGCAAAAGLVEAQPGTVCMLEAGGSDRSPLARMLVKTPFALMFLMASRKQDWRYMSTPQAGLGATGIRVNAEDTAEAANLHKNWTYAAETLNKSEFP